MRKAPVNHLEAVNKNNDTIYHYNKVTNCSINLRFFKDVKHQISEQAFSERFVYFYTFIPIIALSWMPFVYACSS